MVGLSKIVHVVYFNGLNTVGATLPTSTGAVIGVGANGNKPGLTLVEVADTSASIGDSIADFGLMQNYSNSPAQGGTIQYGLYQFPGINHSGKTFMAIFVNPENLE